MTLATDPRRALIFAPVRSGRSAMIGLRRRRWVRRSAGLVLAVMLSSVWVILATLPLLALLFSWWAGL